MIRLLNWHYESIALALMFSLLIWMIFFKIPEENEERALKRTNELNALYHPLYSISPEHKTLLSMFRECHNEERNGAIDCSIKMKQFSEVEGISASFPQVYGDLKMAMPEKFSTKDKG